MVRSTALSKRILALLMVFVFIFVGMPTFSHAANTYYYIQTTINTSTWLLSGSVVTSNGGLITAPIEMTKFSNEQRETLLKRGNGGAVIGDLPSSTEDSNGISLSESSMPLTFPGTSDGYEAKGVDYYNKAYVAMNEMIRDYNDIISVYRPDRIEKLNVLDEDVAVSQFGNILKDVYTAAYSNGTISYSNGATGAKKIDVSIAFAPVTDQKKAGLKDSDDPSEYTRATITTNGNTTEKYLHTKITKGYNIKNTSKDCKFITWDMIAYEAYGNFINSNNPVTMSNVSVGSSSTIGKAVTEVFSLILTQIQAALGLWSIDDLVFSNGAHDSGAYTHGIFPIGWMPYIWAFFALIEFIALMVLLYSLVMNAARRSVETANMMFRRQMYKRFESIAIAAGLLVLLPFIMQILMSLSANLASMLGDITPRETSDLRGEYGIGALSGVIISFLYLGMDIYFNFFYALRGLIVAVLMIFSPFAVVTLTMDGRYKDVFQGWLYSFLLNVFIQPIHALLFTLILMLPVGGSTFDNIILCYAVIPVTGVIKRIVVPGGDDAADNIAGAAQRKTTAMMKGATAAGLGALGASLVNRHSNSYEAKKPDNVAGQGSKDGAQATETKNAEQTPALATMNMDGGTGNTDTLTSSNNKSGTSIPGDDTNASASGNIGASVSGSGNQGSYEAAKSGNPVENVKGAVSGKIKEMEDKRPVAMGVAKTAGNVGLTALHAAKLGAGVAIAMGEGAAGIKTNVGTRIAQGEATKIAGSAGNAIKSGVQTAKSGMAAKNAEDAYHSKLTAEYGEAMNGQNGLSESMSPDGESSSTDSNGWTENEDGSMERTIFATGDELTSESMADELYSIPEIDDNGMTNDESQFKSVPMSFGGSDKVVSHVPVNSEAGDRLISAKTGYDNGISMGGTTAKEAEKERINFRNSTGIDVREISTEGDKVVAPISGYHNEEKGIDISAKQRYDALISDDGRRIDRNKEKAKESARVQAEETIKAYGNDYFDAWNGGVKEIRTPNGHTRVETIPPKTPSTSQVREPRIETSSESSQSTPQEKPTASIGGAEEQQGAATNRFWDRFDSETSAPQTPSVNETLTPQQVEEKPVQVESKPSADDADIAEYMDDFRKNNNEDF